MTATPVRPAVPVPAPPASLLRPDLLAVLGPYLAAQLALSGQLFLLLLLGQRLTGSVAVAGAVAAAWGFGAAVTRPLLSRSLDRRGPVLLVAYGLASGVALSLVYLALAHGTTPLALAAGVLYGAASPPLTATVRPLLSDLAGGDESLERRVFGVDALWVEVQELLAPLAVGALLAFAPPVVSAVAVGAGVCAGAVAVGCNRTARRLHAAARAATPGPALRREVLRDPALRRLYVVALLVSVQPPAVTVALAQWSEVHGAGPAWTGTALAALAAGSLVGGLLCTRWAPGRSAARRLPGLLLLLLGGTVVLVGACTTGSTLLVVLGAAAAGLGGAPVIGALMQLIAAAAPPGGRSQAFSWAGTANFGGLIVGTSAGAQLAALSVPALLCAVATVVALAWLLARRAA